MLSKTIVVNLFSALMCASFVVASSLNVNHLGKAFSLSSILPSSASVPEDLGVNAQMLRITGKHPRNRKLKNFILRASRSPIGEPSPNDGVPNAFSTGELLANRLNAQVKKAHYVQMMKKILDLFQSATNAFSTGELPANRLNAQDVKKPHYVQLMNIILDLSQSETNTFSTGELLANCLNAQVKKAHYSQLMETTLDLFQSIIDLNEDKTSIFLVGSIEEFRKHLPFLAGAFRELIKISSRDPEQRKMMQKAFDLILDKLPEILDNLIYSETFLTANDDSSSSPTTPLTPTTFLDLGEVFDRISELEHLILPIVIAKLPDIFEQYPVGQRSMMHVFAFTQLCLWAIKLQ